MVVRVILIHLYVLFTFLWGGVGGCFSFQATRWWEGGRVFEGGCLIEESRYT